jgi:hypothetical protein
VPAGDLSQLGGPGQLAEADDAEVRLVHAEQHCRVRADRPFVVLRACPVRRAHLDETGAGPRQDIWDPEAVADLDQLSA